MKSVVVALGLMAWAAAAAAADHRVVIEEIGRAHV